MFAVSRSRSPLADLQVASNQLNRLFDEAARGWPGFPTSDTPLVGNWMPPVDVTEDRDHVYLAAELPGVKPEDVKISLENNLLTIRGEKHQPNSEQNGDRGHRFERTFGAFERSFTVPGTVDAERIEARYEQGVLTISLPKAERAKPRQIAVQVQA